MHKILFVLSLVVLYACKPSVHQNEVRVATMGTTGSIKYLSAEPLDFQKQIDSILLDVNMSLSTYIDSSIISKHNRKELKKADYDIHFTKNLKTAKKIFQETDGTFNPAIYPLVNYWKVQSKNESSYQLAIDSAYIDSLSAFILTKDLESLALDFSALAKGYGVDIVAQFLAQQGIENFMVEIGGEVNCKGKNSKNDYWKIGVEEPNEEKRAVFEVVQLKDIAMATSGNYRNFKILDSGQKIVHIINPSSGYPEVSNLLSASIVAKTCMEADAYATACMVMGLERAFHFINTLDHIEGYLLYSDENGQIQKKYSAGFQQYLVKQ